MVDLPGFTPLKKTDILPSTHQWPLALQVGVGVHATSPSILDFCLLEFEGLEDAVTNGVIASMVSGFTGIQLRWKGRELDIR